MARTGCCSVRSPPVVDVHVAGETNRRRSPVRDSPGLGPLDERNWDRAIAAKVILGGALAVVVAPVAAIAADLYRVGRNRARWGR